MVRRALWLAAPLLVLAGCSSGGQSDYQDYYSVIRAAWSGSFGDGAITRQQAAAVEFASMGIRLNGGRENMLILATQANDDLMWTSSAHVTISTASGRIKRTVGLPQDVSATPQGNALPPAAALQGPFSSRRIMDIPSAGEFGLLLTCRTTLRGKQQIVILQQRINTMRVDENCQEVGHSWSFTDSYWISAESGLVWRSIQHIHPNGEIVQLQILRPPG